jgi:type 1 glutamine amidotransferase/PKD repeat protein
MPETPHFKLAAKFIPVCICIFFAGLILCCNMSDGGQGKILINVLADESFMRFSKTEILMIDTVKGDTTVLFNSKLGSMEQLKNIPVPEYRGQTVKILLRGYENGALIYEEIRIFDGKSNSLTDKIIAKDSVSIDPPIVAHANRKPFFLNEQGKRKLEVSIRDTVELIDSALDEDGKIKEYAFDFDGDGVFDSLIKADANRMKITARHVYRDSGKFNSVLRVTDDSGAAAADTVEVSVVQDIPVVYAGPKVVKPPGAVSLTGSASQRFGTIVMYKWDFDGDGIYDDSSATTAYLTHTYSDENAYLARLYVRDDDGNEAFGTREVVISSTQRIVNNPPAISGFTRQFTLSIKDTINLNVTASDEDGKVLEYGWDMNLDGKADSLAKPDAPTVNIRLSKSFPDTGSFKLVLKVKDDSGATVSDTASIQVLLDAPKANAGEDVTVITGASVPLHAEVSDQMGTIVKREWKFGNSAFIPVSKNDTTITVNVVGLLTCILKVTDDDGNQTTDEMVITINPPAANVPPKITTLTVDKSACIIGDTLHFAAHGTDTDGKIVKYFWDYDGDRIFDDSAAANAAGLDISYSHRFVKSGNFTVTLKVRDDKGAVLEKSSIVDVQPALPTADPGDDTIVYAGTTIRLHAAGRDRYGRKVKLEWKGPDGVYKIASNPDTSFAAPGAAASLAYYLRATDEFGQTSESRITVTVILGKIIVRVKLAGRDSIFDTIPAVLGSKTAYMLDTAKLKRYCFQKWVVGSGAILVEDTLSRKTNVTLNSPSAILQANLVLRKILVISATGGFVHTDAIAAAKTAITQMGAAHDFQVVLSDSTKNLPQGYFDEYQTVVFNNVTRAGLIFDMASMQVFEKYFQSGGGNVGIHGTGDVANSWSNYSDFLGATCISHGNETVGTLSLDPESINQSVAQGLPATYSLKEEWWLVDQNPRGSTGTKILLTVDTIPNQVIRNQPVSWFRNYKGGRIFYSPFGHTQVPIETAFWNNHMYRGIVWSANWK